MFISKITPLVRNIKIKPLELGYIRPDKTIKFQTPEIAQTYAKSVVVKALNQAHPIERAILIDESTIIKQVDGTGNSVNFHLGERKFDTAVHGHPDTYAKGVTTPISLDDLETFYQQALKNGATKSIVYNSNGEYSSVEFAVSEKFDALPDFVKHKAISMDLKKGLNFLRSLISSMDLAGIIHLESLKKSNKLEEFIKDIPADKIEDYIGDKVGALLTHNTLKNSADKLHIKYETNFSNLTD